MCGEELEPGWHADHIIPWSVTGQTNITGMQATCKSCNETKGAQVLHKTRFEIDQKPFRPGQRRAFNILCERVRQGARTTGIVLPPGYGKSDVIRLAGLRLQAEGITSQSLILTPSAGLSAQMLEIDELTVMSGRYSLPYGRWDRDLFNVHVVRNGKDFYNSSTLRGATLAALTVQMAHLNQAAFVDYVKLETRRSGRPPLVVLDEAHMTSDENEWGGVVQAVLGDTDAHVALFTATPERTDKEKIPGFDYKRRAVKPVEVRKLRLEQEGPVLVDIYEGERFIYHLAADHETTLRDAWLENPPAICKLNRIAFNPQLLWREEYKGEVPITVGMPYLSDVPKRLVGQALAETLRRPETLMEGCGQMVEALRTRQEAAPGTAAIVFVGNDDHRLQDRTNEHALLVQETLRRIDRGLTSVIATSADLTAAQKTLDDFRMRNVGDVLVVKQMAAVGMDCHRLKVCLDLSPMRQATPFIQRITRIARVWDRTGRPDDLVTTADFIAPDDLKMKALFKHAITAEGGEATIDDLRLLRTEEAGGEPGPTNSFELVGMGQGTKLEDSDENEAPGEKLPLGQRVFAKLPKLTNHYSMALVLNVLDELGLEESENGGSERGTSAEEEPLPAAPTSSPAGAFRNHQAEQDAVASRVDAQAKRLAMSFLGGEYDRVRYPSKIKEVHKELHEKFGLPWNLKYRDLDTETLGRVEEYLDDRLKGQEV